MHFRVRVVVDHLESSASQASGMELLLLRRDLLVCTILWHTMSRGINAGSSRISHLRFPTGGSP